MTPWLDVAKILTTGFSRTSRGTYLCEQRVIGSGLTVGGLLKGGHELDIDCFQEASDTESGGYKFSAGVVIIITIVHHSPDEMKKLQDMFEGLIGKEPPANPAILMFRKANGGRAYGGRATPHIPSRLWRHHFLAAQSTHDFEGAPQDPTDVAPDQWWNQTSQFRHS